MDAVMRYQVADYLNTAKSGTESFALMGVGFNTLDESPNAQKDSKTYINQKSQTSTIKSYQPAFAFDSDLIADEAAVMALYEIGRNQLTGAEAERDYVRVELFKPVAENTENIQQTGLDAAADLMDKDEHAMFVDALPKQQRMLMQSNCLVLPFFRQKDFPLCQPADQSSLNYFASAWHR